MNYNDKEKILKYLNKDNGEVAQTASPDSINGIPTEDIVQPGLLRAGAIANPTSFSVNKSEFDKYAKYGVILNDAQSQEDLDKERAENQSWFEQLRRFVGQAVYKEAILGSLRGFGDIYDSLVSGNFFKDKFEQADFTSAYSKFFEDAQERAREKMEIYRVNPDKSFDVGDFGWWADNAVSIASTLSLMIPARAVTGGIGYLSKLAKYSTTLNKFGRAEETLGQILKNARTSEGILSTPLTKILGSPERYSKFAKGSEIVGSALASRIGENYIEAREVYKNIYDTTLNQLNSFDENQKTEFIKNNPDFADKSNEDIAKYIAGESATKTYRQDFALLLMDIAQFKSIANFWNAGANRATDLVLRTANREAIVGKKVADNVVKEGEKKLGKLFSPERIAAFKDGFKLKNLPNTVGTLEIGEGVEEMFQGVTQNMYQDAAEMYLDPNVTKRSLSSYLADGHIWEQGFWGMLGGIAFQGVGKGLNKLSNKLYAKANKNLSEEEVKYLLMGENAKRTAEIQGRTEKIKEYIEEVNLIRSNKNPYRKNKNNEYEDIKDYSTKDELMDYATDKLIENLTMTAIENGNYDLLRDWVSNSDINQHIRDEGGKINEGLDRKMIATMESIKKDYEQTYATLIHNANVSNPYSAQLASRFIVRRKRELNTLRNQIANDMAALEDTTDFEDFNDVINKDIESQIAKFALGYLTQENPIARKIALKDRLSQGSKVSDVRSVLSQEGYGANLKEIEREEKAFIDFILNNTSFRENDRARDLYAQGEYDKILELFEKEFTEEGITSLKSNVDAYNNRGYNVIPKDLIKKIASYKLSEGLNENSLPKSKEDFDNIYNDFDAALFATTKNRFNRAYNAVMNYIKHSDDYDAAATELLNGTINDKGLQEAMKILKVGAMNRRLITEAFAEDIRQLRNEDAKEAESMTTREINDVTVPVSQQPTVPQTTSQVEQNTSEESDEQLDKFVGLAEEEGFGLDGHVKPEPNSDPGTLEYLSEEVREYLDRKNRFKTEITSDLINEANIIAFHALLTYKDFFRHVNDNTYDAGVQQNLIDTIANTLINQENVDPAIADELAKRGLQMCINTTTFVNLANRKESDLFKKFRELVIRFSKLSTGINPEEAINKINNGEEYSPSKIGLLSDNLDDEFRKIFETYNQLAYDIPNIDGVQQIDVEHIINFFLESVSATDGAISYDNAISMILTLKEYIQQYNGNEFNFINSEILEHNVQDIITAIYNKASSRETINDYMHFDTSTTDDETNPDKLSITERFNDFYKHQYPLHITTRNNSKTKQPISLSLYYVDDNGKSHELGYLGLVKSSDNNNTYYRDSGYGLMWNVTHAPTGEIKMAEPLDTLIKSIIAGQSEIDNDEKIKINNNPTDKNDKESITFDELYNLVRSYYLQPKGQLLYGSVREQQNALDKFTKSKLWQDIKDKYYKSKYKEKIAAEECLVKLSNIIFYELRSTVAKTQGITQFSKQALLDSYQRFVEKIYKNYQDTFTIQQRAIAQQEENKKNNVDKPVDLIIDYVSDNSTNDESGIRDNLMPIVTYFSKQEQMSNHPFVYVQGTDLITEYGDTIPRPPFMQQGMSGILMYTAEGKPYIASFSESNEINMEQHQTLYNALFNHFHKGITDFLESEGNTVEAAYDKLYKMFTSLLGRQRLFTGFNVETLPSGNAFAITTKDDTMPNGKRSVLTFFKYTNEITRNKDGRYYTTKEHKVVRKEELFNYAKPTVKQNRSYRLETYRGKPSENEEIAKAINSMVSSILYGTVDNTGTKKLYDGLHFNSDATVAKNAKLKGKGKIQVTDHIIRDGQKVTITIGDFTQTYDNFAHWLVSNNAFKTAYAGKKNVTDRRVSQAPTSIYVNISSLQTPVQEGLATTVDAFVRRKEVTKDTPLDTIDVLRTAGFTQEQVDSFSSAEGTILPEEIYFDLDYKTNDFAGYFDRESKTPYAGKIVIFKNGLDILSKNRQQGIAFIIHENIHRLADKNDFFVGKEGKKRADAIADCYKQFKTATENLKDDNPIKKFANEFEKEYGKKGNLTIAKEFTSEVFSQPELLNYLNTVDYQERYKVQNTAKETLLQKLLKLVAKLFNNLEYIKQNSILANIYNILGDNTKITLTRKGKDAKVVENVAEVKEEETEQPIEVVDGEIVDEPIDDEDDGDYELDPEINEYLDDDYSSSKIRLIESKDKIVINDSVNPFGYTHTKDLEDYLLQFPIDKRAAIRAEVLAGRIEWLCQ